MMTSADRARAYQLMREEGPFEVDEYIKLSSKEYIILPDEGVTCSPYGLVRMSYIDRKGRRVSGNFNAINVLEGELKGKLYAVKVIDQGGKLQLVDSRSELLWSAYKYAYNHDLRSVDVERLLAEGKITREGNSESSSSR